MTTFKREICRNLDKKVRLRQIFMNFSIPYLGKGEKTKRVCHRLMTHPLGLWVAKHANYCQV